MSISKKILNRADRLARLFGYKLMSLEDPATRDADFVLYEYKDDSGNFDYERYKAIQAKGNEVKLDKVWAIEDNITFLAQYIAKHLGTVNFGLCHGTRRGAEQKWFRDHLNCEVIGTEISDSATEFPYTIQWDFHEVKKEWVNSVDFIYSNSLDHSFDPEKALNAWVKSLRPGGICIIEHSNLDAPRNSNQLDPFGAKIEMMPFLIAKWGKDKFFLREMIPAPTSRDNLDYLYFLIIEKR